MNIQEAVATYIKIRDKKAALKAQYDKDKLKYDEALVLIENKLLEAYDKMGVDSMKTPGGTAYISTQSSASVADRQIFMDHCLSDPENMGLLEVRASKTAVEVYMQEHNGELPPGINYRSERTINVRKPEGKK